MKVETRGSVGAGNSITPEEVAAADLVIVAADIEVDLDKFAGKPMYRTSTGLALKKTVQELDKALVEAEVYQPKSHGGGGVKNRRRRRLSSSADWRFLHVADGGGWRSVYCVVICLRYQSL